ncbi:MAG TPA: MerR family transcriptional regulator [Candidatus Eisenbacteria bacterium]|nr:MerR family transcriptional regulator [Candidatus Eisenbacteria bacterium]
MPATVTPPKRPRDPQPGWLTIGSLARATGIPSSTLRTWERRYRVPSPSRKPSGHRLYPESSIRHLRALRRALDLGRTPSEVMRLPLDALERILGDTRGRDERAPGGSVRVRGGGSRPGAAREPYVAAQFEAAASLDRAALRRSLGDAWTRLGPLDAIDGVVTPFLREVGEAWADGRLSIRHEHFASGVVADFLREARRPFEDRAEGPLVALATLPGDLHEIGLLCAALVSSIHGWRVGYLGPDTPIREISAFAKESGVRAVALSVSAGRRRGAAAAVRELRSALPKSVALWVGGGGAPDAIEGATRLATIAALEERLAL